MSGVFDQRTGFVSFGKGQRAAKGQADPCAGMAIDWDGRLHNRTDLVRRQGGAGLDDASLALHVFGQGGARALDSLIGDWSAAFWDSRNCRLVLASDYTGVRPLYYSCIGGVVKWSVSLAEMLSGSPTRPTLDEDYVAEFLARGGSSTRTPYQDIRIVPPGHALCASEGRLNQIAFWQPDGNALRLRNPDDYRVRLRDLFEDAVAARLQTAGPVFAELSGGLDSTAVVCAADRLIRAGRVPATSLTAVNYQSPGSPDERFYNIVRNELGLGSLDIDTADYPFVSRNSPGDAAPMYWETRCHEIARRLRTTGSTTFLTGRMGDLVMGNYLDDSVQVADLLRDFSIGKAVSQAWSWSQYLRSPVYSILTQSLRSCFALPRVPSVLDRENSLLPSFGERVRSVLATPSVNSWRHSSPSRTQHLNTLQQAINCGALQTPAPLRQVFWSHPFTHRPLVEFMMAIPPSVACSPGEPRKLMRAALAGILPPAVRARRSKASFSAVFRKSLQPVAAEFLDSRREPLVSARGWIDSSRLRSRLRRFLQGLECNEAQLRQVILLELWMSKHEGARTYGEFESEEVAASVGS
jgi:asparagine synthase (glutamine-hydrolysing)